MLDAAKAMWHALMSMATRPFQLDVPALLCAKALPPELRAHDQQRDVGAVVLIYFCCASNLSAPRAAPNERVRVNVTTPLQLLKLREMAHARSVSL